MSDTQCKRVIDYLNSHVGITQQIASRDLGISRLAARIADCKRRGYRFATLWVDVEDRYGNKTRVKEYRLEGEDYE